MKEGSSSPKPSNNLASAIFTDLYQITMAYAYWKSKRENEEAIFELFFRKNPFKGGFTVFCGLDEIVKFLHNFEFTTEDINYLRTVPSLSDCEDGFFEYLKNLDCSAVKVYACREGTVVFPKIPLLSIVGPLGVTQLLETALLNFVNYPSLIATNALRMVIAAKGVEVSKSSCKLVEFGLRRAQGPDGGFSASKYSFIGGFDGTSNVLAGKKLGIPIQGTHAHSFVMSYASLDEVKDMTVVSSLDDKKDAILLLPKVLYYRNKLKWEKTNDSELAAFISYAHAFPDSFLCLVDTYDTLQSGAKNFILVALVLDDLGYKPVGIRLDSGNLSSLSNKCAKLFQLIAKEHNRSCFQDLSIVASNDLKEETLYDLKEKTHSITSFGIGTHLVTCQAQPALGCVYKLVQLNGIPRIKLSQESGKILLPGRKQVFRIYKEDDMFLKDVLLTWDEQPPLPTQTFESFPLTPHSQSAKDLCYKVESLHALVFGSGATYQVPTPSESKKFVLQQIARFKLEMFCYHNPYMYSVSMSNNLKISFEELLQSIKFERD